MLSVWIDFGLEMHGLTMRVPVLATFRFQTRTTTRTRFFNTFKSSARASTSVISAGKRDSRHSTTSFSENVVVAKTSYRKVGSLSFCDQERA